MAKDPYPSETADRFIVRFPDGMRDRLKDAAAENGRSMNAEIVHRLEETFAQPALDAARYEATGSLMTSVIARVAQDMQRDGKSPEEFLAWMRSFPEFARFLPDGVTIKPDTPSSD